MQVTEFVEGTPNWVDLATPDPAGAKDFYTKIFGWSYEDLPTDQGAPYTMVYKDGKRVAGLSINPDGFPSVWAQYIAVDDCDASTAKAVSAGGTVMMPPMDAMGSGRFSFVTDPSGAYVGLWQAVTHKGADIINEPGAWGWSELMTDDVEGAKAFYKAALGLEGDTQDMGGTDYTMLKTGDRSVAGLMAKPMPEIPSHWHVYFATNNVDTTCETIKAHGGSVIVEPMEIPVGRMATAMDPFGATFSVFSMPEWPTE